MAYVFDTNSFSVLGNYYPEQFPSFWREFEQAVASGKVLSVREVYRELESYARHPHLTDWAESHRSIFTPPTPAEMRFVNDIFSVRHFQMLVDEKTRLNGRPCADPFIVARAKIVNGCVVTEEKVKPNAARIPNVCQHFEVDATNLQGFMAKEGWTF